jgi:hypothetical protein
MESEIWPKLWLQRECESPYIDQTVISPDITTLLKQKNDYQLLIVILGNFGARTN